MSHKKWKEVLKKQKSETLGHFIDWASEMIKKTQTSSLRGSMTGSFGDNLVCYSTPQQAKGRNSKAIHCEEKKYESCVVINTNIVQKESSLQSFDEPTQRKNQRNSKAVTFIDSTPVSTNVETPIHERTTSLATKRPKMPHRISIDWTPVNEDINKDATELLEFIELEDYCRRNTDKEEQDLVCPSFSLKSTSEPKVKEKVDTRTSKNKRRKPGKRSIKSKGAADHARLAKKMAITISNDKIMYW